MTELRWRKRSGAILPGGSVKPGKEVVLGSDDFLTKPEFFTIYREPSALVRRIREEKGKSPLIQIDRLHADEPAERPASARSQPWQLPTPGRRLKWRMIFDDDQLHRSPTLHVSRLGTITPSLAPKVGIPHVGEVGVFEIGVEVVASVDPTVELTILTPWDKRNGDLRELLYDVAADGVGEGEDFPEITDVMLNYLKPHLPDEPPPGWEFSLSTSQLELAEGERRWIAMRLRAPTAGSAALAIQMRALDTPDLETVSDVFIIEVPAGSANPSFLFATEDPPAPPALHGDLSELASWGKAAARRWTSGLRGPRS
jgi:hypothetical protein